MQQQQRTAGQVQAVLSASPGVIKIKPYGFMKYAKDYYQAAIPSNISEGYSPVPYFCTCRSIELSLKAYLLMNGYSMEKVKKKGHDLIKCLNAAHRLGLGHIIKTSSKELRQLKKANEYYSSKGFEYFFIIRHVFGLADLPDLSVLLPYSQKYIDYLQPLALQHANC